MSNPKVPMKSDVEGCPAPHGGPLPCDGRLARIETKLDALIRTGDDQERRVRAVEQMVLSGGDKKRPSVMSFIGNLTGILALATVVFYGGGNLERINAEIRSQNARMGVLETMGSSPMREEARQVRSELKSLENRLLRNESDISSVQPELVRIGTKLDGLIQRMDQTHIKTP